MTTSELHNIVKLITPPVILNLARQVRGTSKAGVAYGLSGSYDTWKEAVSASTGYDSGLILAKTKAALLKVKSGEAVCERDSVLFDEAQYSWPILTGLMRVAALTHGQLNVLDFGGSLGSTYFQNRQMLDRLPQLRWNIVEQSNYIDVGKEWFETDQLRFYRSVADCRGHSQPNVIVLGSVLQYLEHPYDQLRELLDLDCDHLIIDRTPFWDGATDRLCVQTVPPHIYQASYPSWIFSRQRFYETVPHGWQVVATFDNPDHMPGPVDLVYQGAIIDRRT